MCPTHPLKVRLPTDEAGHAVRVLRMQPGDEIFLMDGCGTFFRAVVTMVTAKRCTYDIVETLPQERAWRGRFHLAMAPTKMMERTEWMAEKATETGFDELSFLHCRFSERTHLRTDRIEKIVTAAAKQSRKPWMPRVNDLQPFGDFIESHQQGHRFIAHCFDEIARTDLFSELQTIAAEPTDDTQSEVIVLVGPEGDFSIDEVKQAVANGYKSVSLGQSRLRTETAALAAVMMMQLALRK